MLPAVSPKCGLIIDSFPWLPERPRKEIQGSVLLKLSVLCELSIFWRRRIAALFWLLGAASSVGLGSTHYACPVLVPGEVCRWRSSVPLNWWLIRKTIWTFCPQWFPTVCLGKVSGSGNLDYYSWSWRDLLPSTFMPSFLLNTWCVVQS